MKIYKITYWKKFDKEEYTFNVVAKNATHAIIIFEITASKKKIDLDEIIKVENKRYYEV